MCGNVRLEMSPGKTGLSHLSHVTLIFLSTLNLKKVHRMGTEVGDLAEPASLRGIIIILLYDVVW